MGWKLQKALHNTQLNSLQTQSAKFVFAHWMVVLKLIIKKSDLKQKFSVFI